MRYYLYKLKCFTDKHKLLFFLSYLLILIAIVFIPFAVKSYDARWSDPDYMFELEEKPIIKYQFLSMFQYLKGLSDLNVLISLYPSVPLEYRATYVFQHIFPSIFCLTILIISIAILILLYKVKKTIFPIFTLNLFTTITLFISSNYDFLFIGFYILLLLTLFEASYYFSYFYFKNKSVPEKPIKEQKPKKLSDKERIQLLEKEVAELKSKESLIPQEQTVEAKINARE